MSDYLPIAVRAFTERVPTKTTGLKPEPSKETTSQPPQDELEETTDE